MFESPVAEVALIFPFGLAVGFMVWFLWNLHKQGKR